MRAITKQRTSAFGSLIRFGLLALLPVVALGAVLAHELNVDVQQRYLDTAKSSATLITRVGIQPLLDAQQVEGGLTAAQTTVIDGRLAGAAVTDEVRRIKVWNRSGTIVYSDNRELIGRAFKIDDDLAEALEGHSSASITDGHDEENSGDNLVGPLVQVYVPLVFKGAAEPSGAFELYLPYAPVQAAIDRESNQLYALLAAGLSLFYASMLGVVYVAERWRRRLLREAETTALANLAVLERLNNLKSEFITRISHQFRTALVGIEGFSELIRDSEMLDVSEAKQFATDIFDDAERLDRAFADMIELDRMEAGRSVLNLAPSDVNELVTAAVGAARTESPDHPITTQLDTSLPPVTCDRPRLAQVVQILLSNATKYSAQTQEVTVTTRRGADAVTISVRDRGPGMPADFDNGVFFGRHLNGGSGTGLGLPIARQIVDMHGGRIWFESVAGQGTDFHVTVPLRAAQRPPIEAAAALS